MIIYSVGSFTSKGESTGKDNLTQKQARKLAESYARDGNSAEVFEWADGQNDPVSREVFYACDYKV